MPVLESIAVGIALGIGLTFAVAVALKMLAPLSAATRAFVWLVLLLSLPILPPLYFATHTHTRTLAEPVRVAAPPVREIAPLPASPAPEAVAPRPVSISHERSLRIALPENLWQVLAPAYALIALFLLFRLFVGYLRLRLMRRRTEPAPPELAARLRLWQLRCPTARRVELRLSQHARSPLAIGFFKPVIIMPTALALSLTEAEYDDIGVHELAHLRRYDDWTNLLQRILTAVFFIQPAVHYISRRLILERELACDDWVVAAHEGKSYARCLTKIAEMRHTHRGALLLSSGAFSGRRQLGRRIEALLDKTRNAATAVSALTVALLIVALIAVASEVAHLPAVVAFTQEQSATTSMRYADDRHDMQIKLRGEVNFSPDDRSIAAISPDGFLIMDEASGCSNMPHLGDWFRTGGLMIDDEAKGCTHRRLEVHPGPTGAPVETYFLNGRSKPIDGVGRAWTAGAYLFALREIGLDADNRVSRLLAQRGVSGVLDETGLIHSDQVKAKYFAKLLEQTTLNASELQRLNDAVRKISSDNDKANFLIDHQRDLLSEPTRQSFFRAANSINSDNDRRRVLMQLLDIDNRDPETTRLIAQSAKQINSDNDKADVLVAISNKNAGASSCALLDAARNINSDNDKARVLHDAPFSDTPECRAAWFSVANSIQSANDRANTLNNLLAAKNLTVETYREIANSAKDLNDDNDKANVLTQLAPRYLEAPFFNAANTINSSNDRSRVLKAALLAAPSDAATLEIIESAASLPADNEKAETLLAVAKQANSPAVRTALQKACEKIGSDNDYRRVASAIFQTGN